MKIFQVFPLYPQKYQPYNQRLMNDLCKIDKLDIKIVSYDHQKSSEENNYIYIYKNSVLHKVKCYLKGIRNFLFRKGYKYFGFSKKNINFLGKYDFIINNTDAVFHFHNINFFSEKLLQLLINFNIRYIVSLRGHDVTIKPLISSEQKKHIGAILKQSWRVHSVCDSLIENALDICDTSRNKFYTIKRTPNINDNFKKSEHNGNNSNLVKIFTISRIHWKKCISESLISIKCLREKGFNIEYHIIGGFQGTEKPKLLYLIKKLELDSVVKLHGFLDESSFDITIKNMDIAWLPTINEGIPNTLYYLLNCGFPVVAAATDGIPEVITHRKNGVLFSPYDFNDLYLKTHELIENDDLRSSIQKEALLTKFQNQETETLEYLNLYTS